MTRHHYLKSARMMGEQIRYVAEVRGVWLALLGWSGAVLKLACREGHIGWSEIQKRQRLHLIANNARFLMLPGVRTPNLASRILALNTRRLSEDWQHVYGHPILAVETFVEKNIYTGTCYLAAGWQEVGETAGYRRDRAKDYVRHGVTKRYFFKAITGNAATRLSGPAMEEDHPLTSFEIARLPLEESLFAIVARHVQDPRNRRGRSYRMTTLLALTLVGLVCGCAHCEDIQSWAASLDDRQRKRLRLPWNRKTGRRRTPDADTIRHLLRDIEPASLARAAQAWLAAVGVNTTNTLICFDGKVLCNSAPETDREPVEVVTAYAPRAGAIITHAAIPEETTEVPVARQMLEGLDLTGSLCTADAAHTTPETAHAIRKKGATSCSSSKGINPFCIRRSKPLFRLLLEPTPSLPTTVPTVATRCEPSLP